MWDRDEEISLQIKFSKEYCGSALSLGWLEPYQAVLFLYSGITDDLGNWLWSCNSSCKMSKFPCLQNHIMIDFHAFSWFSKQRFVISNEAEQIRKFITGKFAVISVFLLWFSILKSCWKPEYFTHLWQSNEENFDKYGNFA